MGRDAGGSGAPVNTMIQDIPLDLSDFDFEKPCMAKDCREPAAWVGWSSHGSKKCPGEAFVCDKHKEFILKWWADKLVEATLYYNGARCQLCKEPVGGQVSDNVRFLPL